MSDLTKFLLERITHDERAARALAEHDRRPVLSLALTVNHPERILLECEAKRRIVEEVGVIRGQKYGQPGTSRLTLNHSLDRILRLLALPYADHEDYRDEWRP